MRLADATTVPGDLWGLPTGIGFQSLAAQLAEQREDGARTAASRQSRRPRTSVADGDDDADGTRAADDTAWAEREKRRRLRLRQRLARGNALDRAAFHVGYGFGLLQWLAQRAAAAEVMLVHDGDAAKQDSVVVPSSGRSKVLMTQPLIAVSDVGTMHWFEKRYWRPDAGPYSADAMWPWTGVFYRTVLR